MTNALLQKNRSDTDRSRFGYSIFRFNRFEFNNQCKNWYCNSYFLLNSFSRENRCNLLKSAISRNSNLLGFLVELIRDAFFAEMNFTQDTINFPLGPHLFYLFCLREPLNQEAALRCIDQKKSNLLYML